MSATKPQASAVQSAFGSVAGNAERPVIPATIIQKSTSLFGSDASKFGGSTLFGQPTAPQVAKPSGATNTGPGGIGFGVPFGAPVVASSAGPGTNVGSFSFINAGGVAATASKPTEQSWGSVGGFGGAGGSPAIGSASGDSIFGANSMKSVLNVAAPTIAAASPSISTVGSASVQPQVNVNSKQSAEPPKPFVTVSPVYTAQSDGHK